MRCSISFKRPNDALLEILDKYGIVEDSLVQRIEDISLVDDPEINDFYRRKEVYEKTGNFEIGL